MAVVNFFDSAETEHLTQLSVFFVVAKLGFFSKLRSWLKHPITFKINGNNERRLMKFFYYITDHGSQTTQAFSESAQFSLK